MQIRQRSSPWRLSSTLKTLCLPQPLAVGVGAFLGHWAIFSLSPHLLEVFSSRLLPSGLSWPLSLRVYFWATLSATPLASSNIAEQDNRAGRMLICDNADLPIT